MSNTWYDLRHAARSLAKSPGFTLVAVVTLAIGIGANTAIFSVVNAVLLQPLSFPAPERLVRIYEGTPDLGLRGTTSPPNFLDWQRENSVFEHTGAYVRTSVALTGIGDARRLAGAAVTAGFFPVLGAAPVVGRLLSEADAVAGQDRVVVLGHGLWQRQFDGDPGIAGRTVQLEGREYTVIGVMPAGFEYPSGAELWVPLPFSEEDLATQRGAHFLDVIARLAPGVTIDTASSQMQAIAALLATRFPDTNTGSRVSTIGLQESLVGEVRPALLMLLGAVGFVLLIACANVANLLLARTAARRRELAVRNALGAGRGRLIRHVLTESLLLALLGGAAGVLLALVAWHLLVTLPIEGVPRLGNVGLDVSVLVFTATTSLLTALLFGVLPAVRAGLATDLTAALKAGGAATTTDRAGTRTGGAIVVVEMALAVTLLAGAGLLLKSFVELQRVDPGFNPDGVLTFEVALPRARYPEPGQARAFFAELDERLDALPGVQDAAGVFGLPLTDFNYTITVEQLDGRQAYDNPGDARATQVRIITPGYFRTMGIPLLAGRALAATDRAGTGPVVVVNESAAEMLWPGIDPLGRSFELGTTMGLGGPSVGGTVVGVVADIRHDGPAADVRPEVFAAHSQFPVEFMSMTVRSSLPASALIATIRQQVREMDSEMPIDNVRTMRQWLAASVAQPRLTMLLLSIFAVAALFLAAIGIYGILAYAVRQRSNEIGVRRALGARAADVLQMVVGRAMTLAAAGLVTGLAASLALTRIFAGMLFGVQPSDPPTFAAVGLLLIVVALLASIVPARRAVRVDPIVALREE